MKSNITIYVGSVSIYKSLTGGNPMEKKSNDVKFGERDSHSIAPIQCLENRSFKKLCFGLQK